MKKQNYFLVGIMLWMFSSVSFASMLELEANPDPLVSITFADPETGFTLTETGLTQQTAFQLTEDWFHLVFANIGDIDGNFDGDNDDDDGNPGTGEGPAAVPLPSAVWLFGSALFGLAGFKRKPS